MRFVAIFLVLLGCAAQHVAVAPPPPVPENPDRDGDGIANASDQCPDVAEDCDGFEDEDGCPDLDNDKDQIFDACDKCPLEPESWNGYEDDDGCPDRKVVLIREEIRIIQYIHFSVGSARVLDASMPIIEDAARVMVANPRIELLRVEGHASNDEKNAPALSRRRAEAVRDLLVQRGVAPERLEISGEGYTKPIENNATEQGRAKNRRVSFQIVRAAEPPPEPPPPNYRPEQPSCPHGESTAYTVRHCK